MRIFDFARVLLLFLVMVYIGTVAYNVDAAETKVESPQDLWVEVEPTNLLPSDVTGVFYLVPYRARREVWGHYVKLGYSSFTPVNYEPNFSANAFDTEYKTSEMPLLEAEYSLKRNFKFGSIGAEVGVGFYENENETGTTISTLELMPVRLGATLHLDNLFHEPYVAPYGSVGAYIMKYDESLETGGNAFGGNTQVAMYYAVGIDLQLNWIDGESARVSYLESGIENTFIYLEARKFMASASATDPDFETGLDWGAGIRLEF